MASKSAATNGMVMLTDGSAGSRAMAQRGAGNH
jgi:hypothetical protein